MRKHNLPVSIPIYLGSGKKGEKLRENIEKEASSYRSIAEYVVAMLKKAEPKLFRGVNDNGQN